MPQGTSHGGRRVRRLIWMEKFILWMSFGWNVDDIDPQNSLIDFEYHTVTHVGFSILYLEVLRISS